MTKDPRIHKDSDDFSHNYTPVRMKCPECMRIVKGTNHVRVYKNLAGLWRHIKLEHGDISNLEFNLEKIKEVLRRIALAISWEMFPDSNVRETTSSLSILYKGKIPRRDVKNNLKEISDSLKMQLVFPFFRPALLNRIIADKIGRRDSRTMKDYFDCVTKYSVKNMSNGTFDVSEFCEKM